MLIKQAAPPPPPLLPLPPHNHYRSRQNNGVRCSSVVRKKGNVLFNDAFNTFYLRLYGVRHMVEDHSDSKRKETHCRHSVVRAFTHGAMGHQSDPSWWTQTSYFSFQPVLHHWSNKGRGMCYPVCAMMHIKEPLLLIGKCSPCGGSGFPLLLSEWSSTIIYV